ncbi:hypothetical protein B5S32_g3387 [[Candida] boidinii]|nr:hypothetical protein B5S29_g634 [[Candida] boidinii]OWB79173.1 hypothetical protein B5S32_g3387 [[Candida] boidinii]
MELKHAAVTDRLTLTPGSAVLEIRMKAATKRVKEKEREKKKLKLKLKQYSSIPVFQYSSIPVFQYCSVV